MFESKEFQNKADALAQKIIQCVEEDTEDKELLSEAIELAYIRLMGTMGYLRLISRTQWIVPKF